MQSTVIIQDTLDGSHTLYLPEMDEHYHSVNGAIQEARHVYIETAFNQCRKQEIHVLEMGFGTGLNTLLTVLEAQKRNIRLVYTSLEKYPLSESITDQLNYGDVDPVLFNQIHKAEWNKPVPIIENVLLSKIETDFNQYSYPGTYDVVYYDAFAPDKQADVWDQNLFNKIYHSLSEGGILTTYCAKGEIRRRLQRAGFTVNRLPGPPGKREMLQAVKKIII